MSDQQFTVSEREPELRYVLLDTDAGSAEIGEEAYVDVVVGDAAPDQVTERVLFHTVVSEDYAGQGLAAVLVQHVIDDVIARGYRIVPVCPYVKKWLVKHPEVADHVVDPRPDHLRAIAAR